MFNASAALSALKSTAANAFDSVTATLGGAGAEAVTVAVNEAAPVVAEQATATVVGHTAAVAAEQVAKKTLVETAKALAQANPAIAIGAGVVVAAAATYGGYKLYKSRQEKKAAAAVAAKVSEFKAATGEL